MLAATLTSYYVIINGMRGLVYSILYIPLIIYEIGNYMVYEIGDEKKYEQKLYLMIIPKLTWMRTKKRLSTLQMYAKT